MRLSEVINPDYDERESHARRHNKGPSLKDQGYEYMYVNIYRARSIQSNVFERMSYVTTSEKFAKEHAISNANYEEEQQHVIKLMAKATDVYNASNPGEYFYDGPEKPGKIIFVANPGDPL